MDNIFKNLSASQLKTIIDIDPNILTTLITTNYKDSNKTDYNKEYNYVKSSIERPQKDTHHIILNNEEYNSFIKFLTTYNNKKFYIVKGLKYPLKAVYFFDQTEMFKEFGSLCDIFDEVYYLCGPFDCYNIFPNIRCHDHGKYEHGKIDLNGTSSYKNLKVCTFDQYRNFKRMTRAIYDSFDVKKKKKDKGDVLNFN